MEHRAISDWSGFSISEFYEVILGELSSLNSSDISNSLKGISSNLISTFTLPKSEFLIIVEELVRVRRMLLVERGSVKRCKAFRFEQVVLREGFVLEDHVSITFPGTLS